MSEVPALRDVAVVGTGPSGLAAALALAEVGADVVVIGPHPPPSARAARDPDGGAADELGRFAQVARGLGEAGAATPRR